MKKLLPILCLFISGSVFAQSKLDSVATRVDRLEKALHILREFRVVLYAQTQFQLADTMGAKSYAGGDFPTYSSNRFMIRRGRVKIYFDHEGKKGFRVFQMAFQMDMSEKGFAARDFYGRIIDPWTGWVGLQVGLMNRPFGFEAPYSSEIRETPERGRMSQILMPGEKDLGAELIIESPKTFKAFYFRAEGGAYNGTGALAGSFSSHKDFIGHIQARKTFKPKGSVSYTISGGASLYQGGVLQQSPVIYDIEKNGDGVPTYCKITDSSHLYKKYYKRQYYGVDLQLGIDYKIGTTVLRGEYIQGQQPGTNTGNIVPTTLGTTDLNIRHFRGVYAYFIQTFKQNLKGGHTIYHDFVVKYDLYNPNTQVRLNNLNTQVDSHISGADIPYHTIGFGYTFRPYEFFKLQFYYDLVKNPTTNVAGYTRDLKDNVLTIRAQFKFDSDWFNPNHKIKLL